MKDKINILVIFLLFSYFISSACLRNEFLSLNDSALSSSKFNTASTESSNETQPSFNSNLYYQLDSKKLDKYFKLNKSSLSNKNLIINQITTPPSLRINKDTKYSKESDQIDDQIESIINGICNTKISLMQQINNIDSDSKSLGIKLGNFKNLHKSQLILNFSQLVNELNSLKAELVKISILLDTLKQANCDNIEEVNIGLTKSESNLNTAFETIQAYMQKNKELSNLKLIIIS